MTTSVTHIVYHQYLQRKVNIECSNVSSYLNEFLPSYICDFGASLHLIGLDKMVRT